MTKVKGKWALITGASRGIGYRIALSMAEMGCNLVLHSRCISHTEKVLEEVKALGVDAYAVQAELSDLNAVNRMFVEIEEKETHIDIIFNDAGVQVAYRHDFFKTPPEDFTQSFIINTITPMMICYRFIPKMVERGFGRIINTTSGIKNEPQQAGYSASKAALDKVTKDLGSRLEGTNVMINLVKPGWCNTDLGGPHAPNSVDSVIPGMVIGAFLDDKKSGRVIDAQAFAGMTLEDAVRKAASIEKEE
ncbi:MAG: short-chain dehydrogenase/reductase [Herbinix sp.]|jgi:short-subunit dehydrogenase|nr:short-chain dehydrogenase/reductase [Herbinix sp.]